MPVQHERRSGSDRRHSRLSAGALPGLGTEKRWNKDPRRVFGDDDERYGTDWEDGSEESSESSVNAPIGD